MSIYTPRKALNLLHSYPYMKTPFPFWAIAAIVVGVLAMVVGCSAVSVIIMALIYTFGTLVVRELACLAT